MCKWGLMGFNSLMLFLCQNLPEVLLNVKGAESDSCPSTTTRYAKSSRKARIHLSTFLDPIYTYTGLRTMIQVLYLLEICCLG